MKIQTKLVMTLLAIATLVGIVAYMSFNNLNLLGTTFSKFQNTITPESIALNKMKSTLSFLMLEVNEVTLEPTAEHLEAFNDAKSKFIKAASSFQKLEEELGKEDTGFAKHIAKESEEIGLLANEIIEAKEGGAREGAWLEMAEEFNEKAEEHDGVLSEMAEEFNEKAEELSHNIDLKLNEHDAELEASLQIVNTQIQAASQLNLIFTSVALSLAVAMGVLISRTIYKPLMMLKAAAKQITAGDHDVRIELSNTDEMGELASQFEKMRKSIKETNQNLNDLVKMRTIQLEDLNKELIRKDRLKDEFISIASHELRTPVQPILNFADLAMKGHISNEEALYVINKNAKRLQHLANDILDVSKIETGQMKYTIGKVSINDLIVEVVNSMKADLNGDISIVTSLDDDILMDADKVRITQVLTNIINNAIKFTKRGTVKVEKEVFANKNKVVIKISDTGTGITGHILPNLFGKFVSSSANDANQYGTGLGLFISKAIINAHKGEISAHNNVEGGATFTIVLPIDSNKRIN